VEVAAADPFDPHVAREFSFHLGAPIRVVRAPLAAIERALLELEREPEELAPDSAPSRPQRLTQPFLHGAPQTVRPPATEEAPIPLVRKISAPPPPLDADALEPGPEPEPDPGPVLPLVAERVSEPVPLRNVKTLPPQRNLELPAAPSSAAPADPAPAAPPKGPPRRVMLATPAYGTVAIPLRRPARRQGRADPPLPSIGRAPDRAAADEDSADAPAGEGRRPTLRPPLMAPAAPPDPARAPPYGEPVPPSGPATPPALTMPRTPPDAPPAASPAASAKDPRAASDTDSPPPTQAPDPSAVLARLTKARSRDEVVRLALRGLLFVARRAAIFVVRRDGFQGWACNAVFGDLEAVRALFIPQDLPSVLVTATVTNLYVGPIPTTPAHRGLLQIMGRSSPDVVASAVRVGGRPAMVLLADELADTAQGTRFMEELSRAIGDALERLLAVRG
jgi:hypothetical protein